MPETEASSTEPAKDTILAVLFSTAALPPPPPRGNAKRRKARNEDEGRAHKRERQELEAAMRDLISDEEIFQLRADKLVVGASSSRVLEAVKITTNCVVSVERGTTQGIIDAKDTTEGIQTTKGVGSGTVNPQTC